MVDRAAPRWLMAAITASLKSSRGTQLTCAQHNGHFGPGVQDTTRPARVIPKREGLRCALVQCTAHASKHSEQRAWRHRNTRMGLSAILANSQRHTGPVDVQ